MDNSGNGAVRVWYGVAVAALVPGVLLLCDGWLTWHWLAAGGAAEAARATLLPAWWRAMLLPLLLGVPPLLALPALGLAGVRLVRRDCAARAALRAEIERRHLAEEALHHAQKLEAVGRLTGGVAHDFNNQLTVISSNIELLLRRLPDTAGSPRRFADAAMLGVRRAAALTQRLLTLSRQHGFDPEPLDAGHLVSGMRELLCRTLGEKISVDTVCPRNVWLTRTDAGQLEAALLNLAARAREAMPGGGRLSIETANVTLDDADVPDGPAGQYVAIAVRDTGSDMAPECASGSSPPSFDARSPAEQYGPGLAMVHGFVRQSGGHLRIARAAGEGTVVWLYLPRYVPTAPPGSAATPSCDHAGAETVLVVEDDDTVRNAAAEALREIGYQVLEAPDAMEAVRLLSDLGGVDLLFTDVGLPGGVNGRTLADAARNIHPALKVLFTTGYNGDSALAGGLSHEDECFLPKPFSLQQLETKVREVLAAPLAAV